MQAYTREQLEAMKTPQLLKLYNRITKSKAKKFSSRKFAVEKILSAIAAAVAEASEAAAKLPQGNVRTISKMSAKAGRPVMEFTLKAKAEGKSEPRESSLRGQILKVIKESPDGISISALESKFGDKTRAAVQKLIEVDWLTRIDPVAAPAA